MIWEDSVDITDYSLREDIPSQHPEWAILHDGDRERAVPRQEHLTRKETDRIGTETQEHNLDERLDPQKQHTR